MSPPTPIRQPDEPPQVLESNVRLLAEREKEHRRARTSPEIACDHITAVASQVWFAFAHLAFFALWILWNSGFVHGLRPFDPFPFPFLTVLVSLEAIFLSLSMWKRTIRNWQNCLSRYGRTRFFAIWNRRKISTRTNNESLRDSMPNSDVDGRSPVAMILLDVINHFEFPDGERLLKNALTIAPQLARLKARARKHAVATIYVNDNFGKWRSDARELRHYCLRPEALGRKFVERLDTDKDDYLVLKPMHSAFYQSPLELLLQRLQASTLILCGLATNSCVLCTAHDARMRNYRLIVPEDCCAARSAQEHNRTIQHLRSMTDARVQKSSTIRFRKLG